MSPNFSLFSLLTRVRICLYFVGFWFGLAGKGSSIPRTSPCLDVRWFVDLSVNLPFTPSWAVTSRTESCSDDFDWLRTVIDLGPPTHLGFYGSGVGWAENRPNSPSRFRPGRAGNLGSTGKAWAKGLPPDRPLVSFFPVCRLVKSLLAASLAFENLLGLPGWLLSPPRGIVYNDFSRRCDNSTLTAFWNEFWLCRIVLIKISNHPRFSGKSPVYRSFRAYSILNIFGIGWSLSRLWSTK